MKQESSPSKHWLPIMEIFYSIQGEGFHQGKAAAFIRLGGCDVGCTWCDVPESWDASRHPLQSIPQIIDQVKAYTSSICVVTGGEPTLYDLTELTEALQQAGKKTHLETAATAPITGFWNWICISPKKFKPPLTENLALADELKVVVYHPSDLQWAEQYACRVPAHCRKYLQPEWSRQERIVPLLVDYVLNHPNWEISLQIHKYLHVP